MKVKLITSILIAGELWLGHGAAGEVIKLKTGRTFEGQIIEKTDEYVRIKSEDTIRKIDFSFLDKDCADQLRQMPTLMPAQPKILEDTASAPASGTKGNAAVPMTTGVPQTIPAGNPLFPEAEIFIQRLPRNYSGTFAWKGWTQQQELSIHIGTIETGANGMLTALGSGTYRIGALSENIKIKISIDPQTRSFEMWEFDSRKRCFVTDGSHKGELSPDLSEIKAVFNRPQTGQQGTLYLKAN